MIDMEKLARLCSRYESVVAAYLFGSAAKGVSRAGGDIDLAVLVEGEAEDEFPLLKLMSAVERECGKRADVVVLNRAGEVLKYEVRRTGRLIFERDPAKRKQFEVMGRKTWEDFLYLHRRYVRSVLYGKGRNG